MLMISSSRADRKAEGMISFVLNTVIASPEPDSEAQSETPWHESAGGRADRLETRLLDLKKMCLFHALLLQANSLTC